MRIKQIPIWLIIALILFMTGSTLAQITLWTSNGKPVCTASGMQENPMIVKDGYGGVIITWQDKRGANYDIYAQRLDGNGNVYTGWSTNGVAISTASDDQQNPRLISDGAGGAIIVWEDDRTGNNWDIYAQRVDGNGKIHAGWPTNGLAVCSATNFQADPDIISDGTGGAFIAWRDARNFADYKDDIYVQRVDGGGSIHTGWPTNGVAACHQSADQNEPQLAGDGAGGILIVWEDERNGASNIDIYAQRVDGNGSIHSSWPSTGLAICTASNLQKFAQIISDGVGGAFITWGDQRGNYYDIYVHRVNGNGTFPTGWATNGIAICTANSDQWDPMLVSDGFGGALISWFDNRDPSATNNDVYALRVKPTGGVVTGWPTNGVKVCGASYHQRYPQLIPCGLGGAIITWDDQRSGTYDIYAGRVDGNGSIHSGWSTNGVAICTASNNQVRPMIVTDGAGGAIITWEDYRTSTSNADIYAQRLGYPQSSDLWITPHVKWKTADIWLDKDPAVQGTTNKIYARVHNSGPYNATGAQVKFSVHYIAAGIKNWDKIGTATVDVSAGGEKTVSVPWTPKWSGHSCVQVEITHSNDPDLSNNTTQENVGIQKSGAGASAATDFWIFNPSEDPEVNRFKLDFDVSELPPGWSVNLMPSEEFHLSQFDSLRGQLEVHVPAHAMPGDFGSVCVLERALGYSLIMGGLSLDVSVMSPTGTTVLLPQMSAAPGDTICVPVTVSTDSVIGLAQFVVEYDSTVIDFIHAEVGPHAPGFSLMVNPHLPFLPSVPEANDNVLAQINGGGTRFFTGQDKQVVLLFFVVVDTVICHHSILAFDRGPNKTFLTTQSLNNLDNGDILFVGGGVHVVEKRFNITGRVTYNGQGSPVVGALVNLTHAQGTIETFTDSSGLYTFREILQGLVHLVPSKIEDSRGAITGSDALLVLQYLAFLKNLTSHQRIAADVTRDGNITGADALGILRYLAFFTENIGSTGKWRFIPPDTTFELTREVYTDVSFQAFLLGDVTLNWGQGQATSVTSKSMESTPLKKDETSEFRLSLGEIARIAGEEVLVPVVIQTHGNPANTLVFTVEYDPACLEYRSTVKTEMSEHFMIAANGTEEGKVHIAMAGVPGLEIGDSVRDGKSGDVLGLTFKVIGKDTEEPTKLTFSRVFVNDLEIINHTSGQVSFGKSGTEVPEAFELAQNYPNPFNAETIIRYGIPDTKGEPVPVTLGIYNITGQLVRTLVAEKKAPGYYAISWDGTDNQHQTVASGIYFYQIRAAEFMSIKKMAVLK